MSTRANIILTGGTGDQRFTLYHHHDGYPSWLGAVLLEHAWFAQLGTDAMANRLLKMDDSGFELTDSIHGDIEHLYWIEGRPGSREPMIQWAARAGDWESDKWQNSRTRFTLDEFAAFVNSERRDCNARICQMNADRRPGQQYEEMSYVAVPRAPGSISLAN